MQDGDLLRLADAFTDRREDSSLVRAQDAAEQKMQEVIQNGMSEELAMFFDGDRLPSELDRPTEGLEFLGINADDSMALDVDLLDELTAIGVEI